MSVCIGVNDWLYYTIVGSAYAYFRSGNEWSIQSFLVAPDAASSDWFGRSVSVADKTIVVGANGDESYTGRIWFICKISN